MKISSRHIQSLIDLLGIYTDQEFRCVHEYEQLRSDRNGIVFSYITLDVNLDIMSPRKLKSVLVVILKQMRSTDHVGLLNTGQIGLLLPGTDENGSQGFLKNIDPFISGLIGINLDDIIVYRNKRNVMNALSSSLPIAENLETAEAEEVTVIPFNIAE